MDNAFSAVIKPIETALIAGFDIFRHNEVAIALSVVMLLVGLVLGLRFWLLQMRPLFAAFDAVDNQVRRHADARAFAQAFKEVDRALSEPAFLRHGWQEFRATLIHPEKGDDEPIRYTLRPSAYLHVGAVESGGVNLQLQKALPNFFVGFGLLFTFIGLVAALFFANQGVASPNIAVAQEALRNLLHAATFKFLTSVAGMVVSLGMAIANRVLLQRLHNRFVDLCEALEHRLAFISAESIGYVQYQETVRQSRQLADFRATYADEVATALGRAQAPLAASMEHLADNLKDVNKEALSQMAREFIEALNQTAAKELNAIAATLDQLNRQMVGLIEHLGQTTEGFGTRIEGAGSTLEGLLSTGARSLHESLDSGGRTLFERLETGGTALRDGLETGGAGLAARLDGSGALFAERLDGGGAGFSERVGASGTGLADRLDAAAAILNERVTASGEDLSRRLDAAADSLAGSLDTSGRTFAANLETAGRNLHGPVAELTGRWESLESVFGQLDERQQRQFEAFGKTVTELDGTIALLTGVITNLRDAASPISEVSEDMGAAADRVAAATEAVASAQAHLKELAGELAEGAETARASWETYRQRFEETNDDLAETLRDAVAEAQATQAAASDIARAFKEELDKSLEPLDGDVRGLDARLHDMTENLKKLTKALKSAIRRTED